VCGPTLLERPFGLLRSRPERAVGGDLEQLLHGPDRLAPLTALDRYDHGLPRLVADLAVDAEPVGLLERLDGGLRRGPERPVEVQLGAPVQEQALERLDRHALLAGLQ